MHKWTAIILLLLIGYTLAVPSTPLPRKSPEFTISEPSGKTILLSSLKGKVVVLEFLFIQSQHCVDVARMLDRLKGELGPRGFQPIGIVFDPPRVRNSGGMLVAPFVDYFKITYPVGFATKAELDTYLGRSGKELLSIPQVVVIDRAGMIRAATGDHPNPVLENENSLRTLLDGLLKENPPAASPAKAAPRGR